MLKHKVTIVTGSTSGIGLGIAQTFASQGTHLVLNGFGDPATIETLRARLAHEYGVEVLYDNADLSDGDAVRALVDRTHTAPFCLPQNLLLF